MEPDVASGFGFFFFLLQLVLSVWSLSYFVIKFGLTSYGTFGLKNYQPGTHEMYVKY